MMADVANNDASELLAERVREGFDSSTPLRIVAGDSKSRLGRAVEAEPLEVAAHRGIVEYQPTELVVTARAGTSLRELEAILAESGQMLPFEPPQLGEAATLGGTIACGLSGPRRPYSGAARDFTLGVKMINGRGEMLQFGGQVMKNVAGYDVSRLMVGAQGTLGVLLDVSLKVLPLPACERSVFIEMDAAMAIDIMNGLAGKPLPLSAACHLPASADRAAQLCLRLSGAEVAVEAGIALIRREQAGRTVAVLDQAQATRFWQDLRERQLDFFHDPQCGDAGAVWRLSLPPAAPLVDDKAFSSRCLLDWAGAQRWLKTDAPAESVHASAQRLGGHASLMTATATTQPPLSPGLATVHQRLKQAFDPRGILNPGRLYEAW